MDRNRDVQQLIDDAVAGRITRRAVLRRAMVLGLSLPAISAILAACGDDEDDPTATSGAGTDGTPTEGEGEATEEEMVTEEATAEEGMETEEATEEGAATEEATEEGASGEFSMDNPPAVANADAASAFSGTQLTYYGDGVGIGSQLDEALAGKFTEETGIEVEVIPRPESSTEAYSQLQRLFQGESPDMDVTMIDVVWTGAFGAHLVDLSEAFADTIDQYYETIVVNNTVDGSLVGIPWFGDFGILYYRTDLLETYGFDGPPETWDELTEMAQTIIDGEIAANPNFVGFVFQGNAYEGLTCNALEWTASSGGGILVEDGAATIDNEAAIEMFNMAQGWVGTIAPRGVTTYQEEDARNVFQGGNAAFMRNWPYAYAQAIADDSPIKDMFDVGPLPAQEGSEHVGTVGGWQLSVSAYSENQEAAIEFVRYMASAEVQTWRAVVASFVPAMPAVAEDPAVLETMPFLAPMADLVRVTRPSSSVGEFYNEVSAAIYQGVNEILNGQDAADVVPTISEDIDFVIG